MPTKHTKHSNWFFAPKEVGLNRDTDLLKLIAMVTMFIDHLGAVLQRYISKGYVGRELATLANDMRIIGRVAFPIYAYCIAVGCVYSRNRLKYLSRIVMVGLISQPIYVYAMEHMDASMTAIQFSADPFHAIVNYYINSWWYPSILLTLALGLLLCWAIREKQLILTLALLLAVWGIQKRHTGWHGIDYGWQGVALIVLFYLFIRHWWLSLPVMLAYMIWWTRGGPYKVFGYGFSLEGFAMLALPLIYIPTYTKLKINKWVFYWFYPAHMLLLIIIKYIIRLAHG